MDNYIKHIFTAYSPLGASFRKRMGLTPYSHSSKDEPLLVFGCWGSQLDLAINHTAKVVIVWRGGDINMHMHKNPDKLKRVADMKDIKHVAISDFIEEDMKKFGFDYRRFTVPALGNEDIKPRPRGDCVYVYKPKVYMAHWIKTIESEIKDIEFIYAGYTTYKRDELLDVYGKCFCGIRPINHDGLSNSVIEMGLMGRRYAWNGGVSSAVRYETIEDIIEFIYREYENRHQDDYKNVASKLRMDISDREFLNLNIWQWQ